MKKILTYITFALCIIATLSGCSEKLSEWWNNDAPDMTGEEIVFTSQLPAVVKTTTRATSVDNELLNGYKPVSEKYEFSISMYKQDGENSTLIGNAATYSPIDNNTNGDLKSTAPLRWQDNVNKYGFEATAGTQSLEAEQDTKEKWLKQDLLKGFGYEPLIETTGEGESSTSNKIDKIDALNYRTNKEWYNANKTWKDQNGISSSDEYKKIPLFLQHQRALITVILKAGEGVDRKDVLASTASQKIATKIYSYDDSQQEEIQKKLEITPLQGTATVDYDKIGNLPAETNVEVARYDAIVMPHDYFTNAEDEKICAINVANQNFSFYASNDSRYGKKEELSESGKKEFEDAYNLQAGDNLVITATLSRDSRKILITAYVQPWTDVITSYVCDDFGSTGDPIIIDNREQLEAFLKNEEKNASGYVAVLNTNLTLDDWTLSEDLNAILNLGNHTITTDNTLFNNITASGSLINGNIKVKNNSTSDVKTVICNTNEGLIDHINITNDDDHNPAVVGRAAVAITNYGYISSCSSAVKVMGKATAEDEEIFIGGIAAESKAKSAGMLSVINNCTVTGKVDAQESTTVKCGGIVGNANGYVMNNTYEYGVTLNQETLRTDYFKNIVHTKANDIEGVSLIATGNQWPTKTPNTPNNNNVAIDNTRAEHKLFDRVIDCQNELGKLVEANSNYNDVKYSYRIADNFTVLSDTWELGKKSDETNNTNAKNVLFTLDGNNKAITLDGTKKIYYKDKKSEADDDLIANITAPMLFANITGTVKNLTLLCKQSLYGIPEYADGDDGNNMSSDICAPLAYAVVGGTISNIKVHAVPYTDSEGKTVYPKVVAALPSGLVTWAYKGATIENCTSDIDVEMRLASNYNAQDNTLFASGLVAQAADATITQCKYAPRGDFKFSSTYKTTKIYFGGIVGGTVKKQIDNTYHFPKLTISDCASWYSQKEDAYTIGSIIGRAYYISVTGNENVDGVNKTACQGNWWPSGITGVGNISAVGGDEKIIGKKSSVNPDKPVFD